VTAGQPSSLPRRWRIVALYCIVILCWSCSWYASKLQNGVVDAFVSLVWRFGIAVPLMFGWAVLGGQKLKFAWKMHLAFAPVGILMFSANFAFAYHAVKLLSSGLVSVIFSLSTVTNLALVAVIFRRWPGIRSLRGAAFGVGGLALLFFDNIPSIDGISGYWAGVFCGLAMTLTFSLGNVGSAWVQRRGVPIVSAAAWTMLYGMLWSIGLACASGTTFALDMSVSYVGSLLFLAIFGTLFAFAAYLELLRVAGPACAAYCTVWAPIGALAISSHFEQFSWTVVAAGAVALIAVGNILVLSPRDGPGKERDDAAERERIAA
jgi:drug/metabolite transporter (DMT)-like permease